MCLVEKPVDLGVHTAMLLQQQSHTDNTRLRSLPSAVHNMRSGGKSW